MSFRKTAFIRRDHEAITKDIMEDRFDPIMFKEVHSYIDGRGGLDHRLKHGHNREAEDEIRKKWGEDAVDIFRIHIIADRVYDDRFSAVRHKYNEHMQGEPLQYYEETESRGPSYTTEATILDVTRCANCGSDKDLDRHGLRVVICSLCADVRNVEVCLHCDSFFSKHDRMESPLNEGHYLCPVCAPIYREQ